MPRCGCAGSTCSCLITAGPGVQITGSGQASNPYVITASAASIAGTLTVQDTDSVDLSLAGEGTIAEPYVLTADVELALDDLTDVTAAAPTTGYVLAFDGTSWVPVPPQTAEPGAIVVGPGLTGDGSSGSALTVDVSGTWGAAPLDVYGADSLNGLETYIDSAGQVRARGVNLDSDLYAESDPFTSYPQGHSNMPLTQAFGAANWPVAGGSATVFTVRRADRAAQFVFRNNGGVIAAYYRHGNSGGWSAWRNAAAPYGLAQGTAQVAAIPGGQTASVAITFPANTFTEPPLVQATMRTTLPAIRTLSVSDATVAGFTAYYGNTGTQSLPLNLSWLATQMNRASAVAGFAARAATSLGDDYVLPATVTCTTDGCSNEGIALVIDTGWVDDEGDTHPVDEILCGVCEQEITTVVEGVA